MSNAMEYTRYLADKIGYRLSGTEGERSASNYIKEVLDRLGIESQKESFQFCRGPIHPYMIILTISLIGGLFSPSYKFLGFLFTSMGAVAFHMEYHYRSWFLRRSLQGDSENVIGKIPSKAEKPSRRIVISAHYDSSRAGLVFHPRIVGNFRVFSLLTLIGVFGLPVFIICGEVIFSSFFGFLRSVSVLWIILVLLMMLQRELDGKKGSGANDNASGVGVMLSLAENIAAQPLEKTEVWIAATSCEDAGMAGMRSFLSRHEQEMQDALIINVSNVGAGFLKYITGEGMLKVYPSDPELLLFSAEVVRETPEISLVPHEYRTLPTAAHAALVGGYRAMSVMALDEEGVIPNWRWETDTVENLEEQNLLEAEKFLNLLIKKLDMES